jgi:hypothetical protein
MRIIRVLAVAGAALAGSLSMAAPAAAAPAHQEALAAAASPALGTAYMRRGRGGYYRGASYGGRRYYGGGRYYGGRRYYGARYYRPVRYYRPARYYRPVVCRVRYTAWGPRRVCYRRY